MGYSFIGGVYTIQPTTSVSCLGYPSIIIDKVVSTPSQGSVVQGLDPLTLRDTAMGPAAYIDDRYLERPKSARIWRFRTPSEEGTILEISTMSFTWYYPWHSMGLSRIPCDTSGGVGGWGPISEPTAGGFFMGPHRYMIKKNASSEVVACKTANGSTYDQFPQLEPDTIYYLTDLNANPIDMSENPTPSPPFYGTSFKTIPPAQMAAKCTVPDNPAPAVACGE